MVRWRVREGPRLLDTQATSQEGVLLDLHEGPRLLIHLLCWRWCCPGLRVWP